MTATKIEPAVLVVDGRWMVMPGDEVTEQWELDLAQALGYQYEQLTTLTAHPFTFDGEQITATEVVYDEQCDVVVAVGDDGEPYVRTREVKHQLPAGWRAVSDPKLSSTEQWYVFVSPFDREGL